MPLGTRNWGGTEYHDSSFDPESQPQEYEQPYVERGKHSSEKGTEGSLPRPFSLLCFALPILPFLPHTFRVQAKTEFLQSPITF